MSEFVDRNTKPSGKKSGNSPDAKRKRKYIITRTDVPKKSILRA